MTSKPRIAFVLDALPAIGGGEKTLFAALEAFPQAAVLVRAFDRVHLMSFDGLDVAFAQRELFESAVKMGRAALEALGLDAEAIDQVDFEYRLRDCERLELQSSTGDLRAGIDRSFSPDRSMADGD